MYNIHYALAIFAENIFFHYFCNLNLTCPVAIFDEKEITLKQLIIRLNYQ